MDYFFDGLDQGAIKNDHIRNALGDQPAEEAYVDHEESYDG